MSARTTAAEAELRDALAVATTWEEFGAALQEFRTTWPWLSLRVMERRPGCLSRSAISARETGKYPFTEQELRDYLHACRATDDLIDYCLAQHRRIAQSLQAARERSAAQASSDSASIINLPTRNTRSVLVALAQGVGSQEIPDQEVEVVRLFERVDSYARSDDVQSAADTAVEAVSMCDTIYGPDHPMTLQARAVELRWASELFTRSPGPPSKYFEPWEWRKRKRQEQLHADWEKKAKDLRLRWETLIGEYRRVYGTGHRESLHLSRHYAHHIWTGLGSRALVQRILVELIADAERSLGPTDDFPLKIRCMLTKFHNKADGWRTLAEQFTRELGPNHQMTSDVRQAVAPPYGNPGIRKTNFLDYDQLR